MTNNTPEGFDRVPNSLCEGAEDNELKEDSQMAGRRERRQRVFLFI